MESAHQIAAVTPGSPAAWAGISPGDVIRVINGVELKDIFDYYYCADDDILDLVVEKKDHSRQNLHIEKEEGQDLGLTFENGLMDDYRSCHNKCIFCFIDQMPPGMRDTLYFKDDDTRLSFLQGNYVTLTNMKEEDIRRIIHYHMAPINISVHTTDPELRCRMLHNRFAGDILDKIRLLFDGGIEMNAQIVLCKGFNDGKQLEKTIGDLFAFHPYMQSLSVVPVGLTKYREGLEVLEPFHKEDAKEVLGCISRWQQHCVKESGSHFVQASDEWYLLAEEPLPPEENYDGYIQLENGVGMLRLLGDEFHQALKKQHRNPFMKAKEISIATGLLAAPFIEGLCREFSAKFPKIRIRVYGIRNDFFGERITVSGLVTGGDLMKQLKDKPLGEKLLLPQNMLRQEERDFLDDVTLDEVNKTLQVPVDIVKSSGQALVEALLS
jgi:putative radical SAM enzyme (TIGR03279 family)